MLAAARPIWRIGNALKREDDPSAALNSLPTMKSWAEALLAKHPHARGETGKLRTLNSLNDCEVAKAAAEMIEDLTRVAQGFYAELLEQVANKELTVEQTQADIGSLLIAAYTRDVILDQPDK